MRIGRCYIFVLISIGMSFWGCIDEIELGEEADFLEKLAIDGQLKKGATSSIEIQVSQSIPYQASPVTNFVGGGMLKLINDMGEERAIPEVEAGRFFDTFDSNSSFPIETGRAYKIHLELGGNSYESAWDTLYAVPKPDSMSIRWKQQKVLNESENIVDEFLWQAHIHTPLSAGGSAIRPALKWDFSAVWSLVEFPPPPPAFARTCYVTEPVNLDKVVVFDPSNSDKGRVDGLFLTEALLTHKVAFGHFLIALQQSISHSAFVYWDQVSQVVSRSGGFLETPPGKIKGNISQIENPEREVLGLFYASEVDTVRVFMQARDFPTQIGGFCAQFESYNEAPEPCRDCLDWANSTYTRPHFWQP